MPLQNSGPISLDDLHVEAGGTTGTTASLNDADIRDIITKASDATNSISEYYGQSATYDLGEEVTPTVVNGQNTLKQIRASDYISAGGSLTISSDLWIWSDSTSVAALIVDVANARIINNGKIIGKGGAGGNNTTNTGSAGGPAISVTASGVSVTNNSGAYIAGGGGGGGAVTYRIQINEYGVGNYFTGTVAGGGGGAGGGVGGFATGNGNDGGAGGTINANGGEGEYWNSNGSSSNVVSTGGGDGGGAGGAGGEGYAIGNGSTTIAIIGQLRSGGGGGRKLPGTGASPNGGSGGSAGSNGASASNTGGNGGGGGGWGAAGGRGTGGPTYTSGNNQRVYYNHNGGAGGAAITGNSVTLTNNGTIYGSTS